MQLSKFDKKIINLKTNLTPNEKVIVEYIHSHPSDINQMTISQLAKKLHYSSSFISKTVKKIGYVDLSELRYELKNELLRQENYTETNAIDQQKIDIDKTNNLLLQTNFQQINKLIQNATAIYVYGTGHSQANYMRELSRNLMQLVNVPVIFLSGLSEFESVQTTIKSTDCICIASISGESSTVLNVVKYLVLNKVPIVSFTVFSDNTLASLATYSMFYYSTPIQNPVGNRNVVSYLSLGFCIDFIIREYINYLE
ncbi:MurR/RpiR family transcriptional regulator [Companilactobacillus sp. HBUAS59544]|uniref:MurR/RpiR family transcriptional regulator n=1 Tax=Companilactobacillus sp. HBUAS59544 TaxID=3109363 RepID=UPI002FF120A0